MATTDIAPIAPTPPSPPPSPGVGGADTWKVDLCGGCCKASGCAGCCCPCCVIGANAKMVSHGVVVQPMDGCGGVCCAHAAIGGIIQGAAIFFLGPLAALVHLGSLVGCCVRTDLRKKYNIPGNPVGDCCIHYCCGPCAVCQEYEELVTRINATNA